MEFKTWLSTIFKAHAAQSILLTVFGGIIFGSGYFALQSFKKDMVTDIKLIIKDEISHTNHKIDSVDYNNNFNHIITRQRISTLEDTVFKDNKVMRKEIQRLTNEKYKLKEQSLTEKKNNTLKYQIGGVVYPFTLPLQYLATK